MVHIPPLYKKFTIQISSWDDVHILLLLLLAVLDMVFWILVMKIHSWKDGSFESIIFIYKVNIVFPFVLLLVYYFEFDYYKNLNI